MPESPQDITGEYSGIIFTSDYILMFIINLCVIVYYITSIRTLSNMTYMAMKMTEKSNEYSRG